MLKKKLEEKLIIQIMSTILMSISCDYIYLNVNFNKNVTAPHRQFQKTISVFSCNLVLHQHSAVRNVTV